MRKILFGLLLFSFGAHAQKISELPAASALGGTEVAAVVQSGATKKATINQWKAYIVGAGSVSVASGKTATISNTLTFTGTDASSVAFGAGGTVLYSGGALGTPSSGTLTNATGLPVTGMAGSGVQCARLYSTTGVPVPISDTTTVSTIYVGPYQCDTVTLIDASDNAFHCVLTEKSLALSGLTSGKPYDVFLDGSGGCGSIAIELSAAWTNDTTRADAVTTVKGIVVKNTAHTRVHYGTIYTTGTTSTTDTAAKRYVWNRYNQRPAFLRVFETTNTWTYTTAALRQANGSTANQLDYVTGDASTVIAATLKIAVENSGATVVIAGIGLDSTTALVTGAAGGLLARITTTANVVAQMWASYVGLPGLGKHSLTWLEYSTASGTTTWWGDGGSTDGYSGIYSTIMN